MPKIQEFSTAQPVRISDFVIHKKEQPSEALYYKDFDFGADAFLSLALVLSVEK